AGLQSGFPRGDRGCEAAWREPSRSRMMWAKRSGDQPTGFAGPVRPAAAEPPDMIIARAICVPLPWILPRAEAYRDGRNPQCGMPAETRAYDGSCRSHAVA